MARIADIQLPPPENWQDFESLCNDLFKEIWRDPGTQKNGRGGQSQAGVDVFGLANGSTRYTGVQCKGKSNYSSAIVSEEELHEEVEKAKTFTPKLSAFILATTARRDEAIQKVARKITEHHLMLDLFTVSVSSWDDLKIDLGKHLSVVEKHYPDFFLTAATFRSSGRGVFEIDVLQSTIGPDVGRLLSDSPCGKEVRNGLREDIHDLISELSINAYRHANSSWCTLGIEPNAIELRYDGPPFNPKTHLENGGSANIGLDYFKGFIEKYGARFSYRRIEDFKENRLRFEFVEPLSSPLNDKSCRIEIPDYSKNRSRIVLPPGCKTLYADLSSVNIAPSDLYMIIGEILRQMSADAQLVLTFPSGSLKGQAVESRVFDPRVTVRR